MFARTHLLEGRRERRKELREEILPTPSSGVLSLGAVCPETGAPRGVKGLASAKLWVPVVNRSCFMSRFCVNLAKNQHGRRLPERGHR